MACDKAQVEKELKGAFDMVDTDKSGFIDSSEVEKILTQYCQSKGHKCDQTKLKSQIADFVKALDTDKDGKVSFREFSDFVTKILCS